MSTKYKVSNPMKSYAEKKDMYYVEGLDTVSDYEDWGYTLESATLIANTLNTHEQLQATNQELLSALEKIVAKKDDVNYSQDDWMYQALDDIEIAEEAITNAKQMGDKG